MEIYPIIKGTLNSCYDYNKMFSLQSGNVVGYIKPKKKTKTKSKSKGPSLILSRCPRSTNRHK